MSRPFRNLFNSSVLVSVAAFALTACGGGSSGSADLGGGSGGGVVVEKPVTVNETFNFSAPLNYFVVGTPPIHARFLGGVASNNGAWIVKDGTTATINFGTPADAVKFDAKDETVTATTGTGASKTGAKASGKFDVATYVRGSVYNDWVADAGNQLASVSNDVGEVTIAIVAGSYEFKIADAGWATINCGANTTSDTISLGSAYTTSCGTNPGNLKLTIAADGNYKFSVNSADVAAPVLTVTKVTAGGGGGGGGGGGETRACGLANQGLDNTAPYGVAMYVRGSVKNDWAAAPENQLWQFGGNVLKVELEVNAGPTEFKVADAGWQNNCGAGDNDTVALGTALTMACGTNPGNLKFEVPTTDCYEFAVNASNKDAPVVTVKKAVLTTGGGEPTDSAEIRIYARDVLNPASAETLLKTVKGAGTISVDETRVGGDTRITRIEIQNLGTAGDLRIEDFRWTSNPKFSPAAKPVDVYYRRPTGGYASTNITVGGKQYACTPTTSDAYGCVVKGLPLYPYQNVSMSVSNGSGSPETIVFNADTATQPVYAFSGIPEARLGTPGQSGQAAAVPQANEVILYYKRKADDYSGWGVHLYPKDPAGADWTTWAGPLLPEGVDPTYGAYFRIQLPQNKSPAYSNNPPAAASFPNVLGFIIHKGDTKDPGPDQQITIAQDGNMVFVVSGVTDVSSTPQYLNIVKPVNYAAHWVTEDTVLWKAPTGVSVSTIDLLYSPDASLTNNVTGGFDGNYSTVRLGAGTNPQIDYLKDLSTYPAYSLPASAVANAKAIARSQIYIVARNASGAITYVTRAQIQGALDDLYSEAAKDVPLGPTYTGGVPKLSVWAPTALTDPGVTVQLYNADGSAHGSPVPMTLDAATGIWSVTGDASWDRLFYTYTLRTYSNYGDTLLTNTVSDPYAVSGNTDGSHSQIVNLEDADLKPAGWDSFTKPALEAPEDAVLYELHVRDFSIADPTVPVADRGKFTAFDVAGTNGRSHLQALATAGLTHVHLLPSFDIASVPEDPSARIDIDDNVQKLCDEVADAASLCFNPANGAKTIRQLLTEITASGPTSLDQQKIVGWINGVDGFNWGYDPYHYGSPEGSYSTDPNGAKRVLDFRRMVKGLSDTGLRTVMDVVYNHTASSGMNDKSVFDRVVPGYYQRRDLVTGGVTNKQCCNDIGTEWKMGEKLMFDTALRWVTEYKVDGFRFDIMAAHTKDQMQRLLAATRAINPAFYIYGEGWNTGGGQDDKRYVSARQDNLAGTGIGSFNDRMRDGVRGGGCCDSGAALVTNQGITSGLWYDPNSSNSGSAAEKSALLDKADRIRAQLAGGIKSYTFQNSAGTSVAGSTLGSYVTDPEELIQYVEVHDNMTFWDVSQFKQPIGTPTADRVRAQNVGTSFVLLAEGVPFLHAGQEILRSKSTDTNSYNSGDWFNDIDWTLATGKWAVGLPPQGDNAGSKTQALAALSDPSAAPSASDRQFAFDVTKEWLKIRKSSVLFRLRTADQIKARMTMLNTGPSQQAGVIAYRLDGCSTPELPGQPYGAVVTIFNPTKSWTQLAVYKDEAYALHPAQATGADAVVKTATHDAVNGFRVPPRTTAVFVRAAQTSCAPYGVPMFVRGTGGDWSATPARELQYVGGTSYSRDIALVTGEQQFKIADNDWTGASNCGAGAGGLTLQVATPSTLLCDNSSGNINFSPPSAGNYTFVLEAANQVNPVLTVSKTAPFGSTTLYVRGVAGDWGTTNPMAWDGIGKYRAEIFNLAAGASDFKIADADWTGPSNCGAGAGSNVVALGTPYALNCNNSSGNLNITLPSAGSYLFAVDGSNPAAPSLTVEKIPFTAALYIRGVGTDWDATAGNRLSYLGSGIYRGRHAATAGADADGGFKIADAGWTDGSNCGAATAATVGTGLPLKCAGPGNDNIAITWPSTGNYTFTLDATSVAAPVLTVSGP